MKILTAENKTYNLEYVPSEIEDIRYCVFDCNDPAHMDFYFYPLIFLESFFCPAVVLEIGNHKMTIPLDWSMVVCDEDFTEMEVVPISSLNDRGFYTFPFNPLRHMAPAPVEVNIVNVYAEVKWFFPKLRDGVLLPIPIEDCDRPRCVMFVKERNKLPSDLSIGDLLG